MNYSKETLLEVLRCGLAEISSGAYQAYNAGEGLLVIIATIIVYVIALVKAHRSGKFMTMLS